MGKVTEKNMNNASCACDEEVDLLSSHIHSKEVKNTFLKEFFPAVFAFVLLIVGVLLTEYIQPLWWNETTQFIWYLIAYLPVAFPVLKQAVESMRKGAFFSEFFLMSIATIGAFAIKEFPEGVAVMLFYTIGELFQERAVKRAQTNIKELLDQRPDEVSIIENNVVFTKKAKEVKMDEVIQLKAGEQLALDGILITDTASFNTAALTGESKPDNKYEGDEVLAGMINLNTVAKIKITRLYEDSKLAKILELVQESNKKKAPTELFIRKFAKIYTPIVVFLAIGICLLPYFFMRDYDFQTYLYRALVFLVISCPCALVISIPLGYFGGIGAASKHGILIKGGNYLDALSKVKHVVMDKTGTLTEGVFQVQTVHIKMEEQLILDQLNMLESHSSHPVATAIHQYVGKLNPEIKFSHVEEVAGMGLKGLIEGQVFLAGNEKLLKQYNIPVASVKESGTHIFVAYNDEYRGFVTISDKLKVNAAKAVTQLQQMNIETTMLSGDQNSVVQEIAQKLGIKNAYGSLLPQDKVTQFEKISNKESKTAFVGDGINDAPVLALSDVGIAMGGLGSDAAIETADVVIQDDNPAKIPMAIKIGKMTQNIIWQNIILAFVVKAIVLVLGAGGIANMWEAVFADVGVAFLAILNAIRIQKHSFSK